MTYPLVRDLAAEGIPVRLSCQVLGFSAQAFYKWNAQPVCQRDLDDAYLTNAIIDAHRDDPEFGYRFLADELEAAGHDVGERRVWRLCSEHQVWSTTTKKGRRNGKGRPGPAVHDDLASGTSPRIIPIRSGSPTSPNTRQRKARCTAAPSRTCSPTGSSVTPSTSV